jgi:predicted metal-binding membrane protein
VGTRDIAVISSVLGLAALGWAVMLAQRDLMAVTLPSYLGIWIAMTVAMMLPSAAPMLLLVDRLSHRATPGFLAGYVVAWGGFGLAAYAVSSRVRWHATAALLVAAGVHQLLPLKRACLRRCRNPLAFLRSHAGEPSLAVGIRHGMLCIGCCAGLMVVLLALGMMSLVWMTAIAVAILAEKVLPLGERIAPVTGAGLIGAGLVVAIA